MNGPLLKVLRAAYARGGDLNASLLAAGVAFYAFTSLFPALIAGVLLYGLFASPETVQHQSAQLADALPADAASVITGQLETLVSTSHGSLGFGLVLALGVALFSASGGVGNLVVAVNAMYGIHDRRNLVKKRGLALALTAGAIVLVLVLLTVIAVVPAVLNSLVDSVVVRIVAEVLRWALVVVAIAGALSVLYRVAPDRTTARARTFGPGIFTAAIVWAVASLGFSVYVDHFGSYAKTYGALAGVVILLLWLWLSVYVVLLGAVVEADAEGVHELVYED